MTEAEISQEMAEISNYFIKEINQNELLSNRAKRFIRL